MNAALAEQILARVDRELWLVTAAHGEQRSGLIATCVNSASIVPHLPRVLVGLSPRHLTAELAAASGGFGLHLLDSARKEWVERFGLNSGRVMDKFAGLETISATTGSPLLAEAPAWLDCRIEATLDGGDRLYFLAEVVDAGAVSRDFTCLRESEFFRDAAPSVREVARQQRMQDARLDADAIVQWRLRAAKP